MTLQSVSYYITGYPALLVHNKCFAASLGLDVGTRFVSATRFLMCINGGLLSFHFTYLFLYGLFNDAVNSSEYKRQIAG
jgi:hypothetical protein